MSSIIPFESGNLPDVSHLFGSANDLSSGGGGFPIISIKGKVFHVRRGDETTLIAKPDTPDEPAASIEVAIIKVFPGAGKTAKTFYTKKFVEGSDEAPDCSSNDGVAPAADSPNPQSSSCATCQHNAWGSRITEDGKKAKACADVKRLAVAAPDRLNDPMLLRVPAASLKALTAYSDTLSKRGLPYQAVLTRIGFDYSVAHPALTFKGAGLLDEASILEVASMQNADIVNQIVGVIETPRHTEAPEAKPAKATKAAAKLEAPVAEKPAKEPPPAPAKKTTVKVEGATTVDTDSGMAAAIDSLEFDD